MKFALLCVTLLACTTIWTQELTPEQKKQLEEEMKKMEAEIKKAFSQPNPTTTNAVLPSDKTSFKAPKKRTALLAELPKKLFSDAEALQYVKTLQQKFELAPANKETVAYVKKNLIYKTAREFYYAAIISWYKGKQSQAIYVSLKALALNPSDILTLNNLCAFLNMGGYPHKGIPLLNYGLSKAKNNVGILNNLGQAYYQLGDLTTSSNFLTSCTRIEQFHIEANNTLGHIASANGNAAAATHCYENSLKGGYNTSAASQLGRMGKQVSDKIRMPAPSAYPESDDNIGFTCPTVPADVTQNAIFNDKMTAEQEAWSQAEQDYKTRVDASMQQAGMNMANVMRSGSVVSIKTGVMFEKAGLIMAKSYVDYMEQMKRLVERFAESKKELDQRYERRFADACQGNVTEQGCCNIHREIQREKQMEFARLYNEFCQSMWGNAKGHSNTVAYWMPLFSPQRGLLDRDLYTARYTLLATARTLSSSAGVDATSMCLNEVASSSVTKDPSFNDPDCKFSLKIPLVIGDFVVDCQKISLSGGEGIVGGIEYNFLSGQSTISLGIGAQLESGIVGADLSAQYYVTFDGNLNMQDGGLKYSAGVSAGEVSVGPLQFDALSASSSVTVSVESGVTASTEVTGLNTKLFSNETNLYSFSDN